MDASDTYSISSFNALIRLLRRYCCYDQYVQSLLLFLLLLYRAPTRASLLSISTKSNPYSSMFSFGFHMCPLELQLSFYWQICSFFVNNTVSLSYLYSLSLLLYHPWPPYLTQQKYCGCCVHCYILPLGLQFLLCYCHCRF